MTAPARHHRPPSRDGSRGQTAGRARVWLFTGYLALYLGFMLLTVFDLPTMASTPFGGVNLAILYGLTLIGTALALALLYMWFSRE